MQKAIAEVFTWPSDTPQLIASRCDDCAATTFPVQHRCPRCGTATMTELLLPRRGTLVSWTTQAYPPMVPYAGDETGENFVPFGVGLVQLDDIVRVESRLPNDWIRIEAETAQGRDDLRGGTELNVARQRRPLGAGHDGGRRRHGTVPAQGGHRDDQRRLSRRPRSRT